MQSVASGAVYTAIQNAIAKSNYSTSEVDTGKTWIDGKKIYRKAGSKSGSLGSSSVVLDSTLELSYIDTIIDTGGSVFLYDFQTSIGGYVETNDNRACIVVSSNGLSLTSTTGSAAAHDCKWWIEYTKK